MINIARNFLIMIKNLQLMRLKLLQIDQIKKQQKQPVVIKLLKKLQTFRTTQQNHSETVINEHDQQMPKEIYISRKILRNY